MTTTFGDRQMTTYEQELMAETIERANELLVEMDELQASCDILREHVKHYERTYNPDYDARKLVPDCLLDHYTRGHVTAAIDDLQDLYS